MTGDQKTKITEYVTKLDSNISEGELLDLVVELTVDRVLLYLNTDTLEERLERIVAQIVAANYHSVVGSQGGIERSVSRIEDNGQAVTYTQAPARYFATATDDDLFSGFAKLLAMYRRVHVATE